MLSFAEPIMEPAVVIDRARIARDLHDTVIQRMFGAGLSLHAAKVQLPLSAHPAIDAALDELDLAIAELRNAVFALRRPPMFGDDLKARFLQIARDAGPSLGFEARVRFDGPIEAIADEIAEHLLPVLREALSNIVRHAEAHSVQISLRSGSEVVLTVTDDGVGAESNRSWGTTASDGNGLRNMAERAKELGGTFDMSAPTNGGSTVCWRLPSCL